MAEAIAEVTRCCLPSNRPAPFVELTPRHQARRSLLTAHGGRFSPAGPGAGLCRFCGTRERGCGHAGGEKQCFSCSAR